MKVSLYIFTILSLYFYGCSHEDHPKSKLVNYLEKRANGSVSDNINDPSVYLTMLIRLKESRSEQYTYLWHDISDKYLTVYWYGKDAEASQITGLLNDGSEVEFTIGDGYKRENAKYLLIGEPQYLSVPVSEKYNFIKIHIK